MQVSTSSNNCENIVLVQFRLSFMHRGKRARIQNQDCYVDNLYMYRVIINFNLNMSVTACHDLQPNVALCKPSNYPLCTYIIAPGNPYGQRVWI